MNFNNPKANLNIYNRIKNINMKTNLIQILFSILEEIIDINVELTINYFIIKGNYSSCQQFLFQNYYILTVYKT